MGCGCKDNNVNEIIEKGPITFKSVLNKSISTIMWVLLLTILTPFIVILIWYYVIGSVYGGNINTLNLLLKYIKDKKDNTEEIEDDEEVDYELMDVDVIK